MSCSSASTSDRRRAVPSVDKLLSALGEVDLPRPAVVAVIRRELAALRAELRAAKTPPPDAETVLARVRAAVEDLRLARLQPVINGAGVLLHTNLGRAPLSAAAAAAAAQAAAHYTNLEFDLATGRRGRRAAYLEHNLALLCQAEAATVVNNCAAALVLMLRHFADGPRREVLISRGELIQIGGGFRIPEILETSGAVLREVGTTNRTTVEDYARALGPDTALILKVHRSNFFMRGFVESPDPAELAALAKKRRLPFVEDLGSGAVVRTEELGLAAHEPTPAEVLRRGVDLVCFSGDKLLGGPQAGIIAGKRRFVVALKRNSFFRALRCDKLVFAALQATVDGYLTPGGPPPPALARLRIAPATLRARAEAMAAALADLPLSAAVGTGHGRLGGGALPQVTVPSVTLDLRSDALPAPALAARLRRAAVPVVGYVAGGRFKLDLRTIEPEQDEQVVAALRKIFAPEPPSAPARA